jgi:hypothetical protein
MSTIYSVLLVSELAAPVTAHKGRFVGDGSKVRIWGNNSNEDKGRVKNTVTELQVFFATPKEAYALAREHLKKSKALYERNLAIINAGLENIADK